MKKILLILSLVWTVFANALGDVDADAALVIAKQMMNQELKGELKNAVTEQVVKSGDESLADKIIGDFAKMPISQNKFQALNGMANYLAAIKNTEKVKWGIDEIVKFRDGIPAAFKNQTDPFINGQILKGLLASKDKAAKAEPNNAALQELANYIKSKLPEEDKKGF